MTDPRVRALRAVLRVHVAGDSREEADRIAMLRLLDELERPLSRVEEAGHFTASAFVVDAAGARTCLVAHAKLGRLLQPGGHVEDDDESLEQAALREAREETGLELGLHPTAPRPFHLDVHEIPASGETPAHYHLDVRYLVVGRGAPCSGAAWYPLEGAADSSVGRLSVRARSLETLPAG
jgi:8-oxo-dGTP pyrophosphatase MutT (NUDIX family)